MEIIGHYAGRSDCCGKAELVLEFWGPDWLKLICVPYSVRMAIGS